MKDWEKIMDDTFNDDLEDDFFEDDDLENSDDDEQVDLLEYAKSCENQQSKQKFTVTYDEDDIEKKDKPVKKNKKARRRIIICLTAIFLSVTVLFGTVAGVFLHYYNKLDYVADDFDYYDNDDEDLLDAPYVTNILLIGTDERTAKFSNNARADSTMILSINTKTHQMSLISLERGMSVKYLKGENQYSIDLLTHVFKYGGAGLLLNTVQDTFKIKVDKYVRVNFNTFEQIINKLGGVDVTLTSSEAEALSPDFGRTVSQGKNHLNGSEALLYARLRKIDSDFQRVKRQRNVLFSIKDKMKNTSYTKLLNVASDILPLVRTNISADEMAKLLLDISSTLGNDAQQATIPIEGSFESLGSVNFEMNTEFLRQTLYSENKEN